MPPLQDSIVLQVPDELQDDVSELPSPTGKAANARHILIYFIPGNPGLIEYYRPFLTYLRTALEPFARRTGTSITIAGHSLANFHIDGKAPTSHPLNLQEMITWTADTLASTVADAGAIETILVGHSVGAYIMMSLLHRLHTTSPPLPSIFPRITSTIGLFPTIVDLALSSNGLKAAPLTHLPFLPQTLHLLARVLTSLLPTTSLQNLVQRVTDQPHRAATVTTAFLASPRGVQQAVHLAQHELREMRQDVWGEEVWCADPPSSSLRARTLFFYFGQADHWVADATREAIIARRGRGERVKMEVDGNGVPHDFCVREEGSRVVAERVARVLLEDVLGTR